MGEIARTLAELTIEEFHELLERSTDRRFEVWLTRLIDTFEGPSDENRGECRPEFAASLRRSPEQARAVLGASVS